MSFSVEVAEVGQPCPDWLGPSLGNACPALDSLAAREVDRCADSRTGPRTVTGTRTSPARFSIGSRNRFKKPSETSWEGNREEIRWLRFCVLKRGVAVEYSPSPGLPWLFSDQI